MVAISEVFSCREDWHQYDCARPLVGQYQLALDALLTDRPDLQDCAVGCCQCGIRFFTHPRNRRRQDLRCPFGCRTHHRRQQASARSRRYSQSEAAKRKKKRLNCRRSLVVEATPSPTPVSAVTTTPGANIEPMNTEPTSAVSTNGRSPPSAVTSASPPTSSLSTPRLASSEDPRRRENEQHQDGDSCLELEGMSITDTILANSPVLQYLAMAASFFERRIVSREELVAALRRRLRQGMRQRSIGHRARREYALRYLNEHPP